MTTADTVLRLIHRSLNPRVCYLRKDVDAGPPSADCDLLLIEMNNHLHIECDWVDAARLYVMRLTGDDFNTSIAAKSASTWRKAVDCLKELSNLATTYNIGTETITAIKYNKTITFKITTSGSNNTQQFNQRGFALAYP